MLLKNHDAILSDLDGVVYAGPHAIDGAPQALNRAEDEGVPVAFVTNNASRSVETIAEHLRSLGVNTSAERIVSSAQAAAELLREHLKTGAKVLITGTQDLAECVEAAGFKAVYHQTENPQAVVQGFNPKMVWENLAEAAFTLADPEILWIATNTDWTIPQARGMAPGNGTLVHAVAKATGRTPYIAGKPEAAIFRTGAQKLKSTAPVVVGDRLDTDIRGGNKAGIATACVLTGVESYQSILQAPTFDRPDYILSTLNDFFIEYPKITVTSEGESYTAEGAGYHAKVEGEILTITGEGEEPDAWRVACAAWWTAYPQERESHQPKEIIRGKR
ncbi:HAD-IIA family hydrolase [Rothia sp. CCM 9418]|uniref:HAD-IIA family hydrolase n=1 Tax=Rothia sp. CCM 9418 TaxID=3402661 RepID=UPI003AE02CC0